MSWPTSFTTPRLDSDVAFSEPISGPISRSTVRIIFWKSASAASGVAERPAELRRAGEIARALERLEPGLEELIPRKVLDGVDDLLEPVDELLEQRGHGRNLDHRGSRPTVTSGESGRKTRLTKS